MSEKMRRYMPVIAFWILVILSAFHFALAAPVAVREILEVRSNAVGVLKDGIAAWEKRMDSDDEPEDQWSTNEQASESSAFKKKKPGSLAFEPWSSAFKPGPSAFEPGPSAFKPGPSTFEPGPSAFKPGSSAFKPWSSAFKPGPSAFEPGPLAFEPGPSASEPGPSAFDWYPSKDDRGKAPDHVGDAPGGDDEDSLGSESLWNTEQMGSDGRWPDPNPDNEHDGGKDNDNNYGSVNGKGGYNSDDNKSGYEADYDSDGEHGMQSSYGSNIPGPHSEPEHTASPDPWALPLLDDLRGEDLLKGWRGLRPRNSGSGAVYAKEGVAGDC
jgi:hypothetical protein